MRGLMLVPGRCGTQLPRPAPGQGSYATTAFAFAFSSMIPPMKRRKAAMQMQESATLKVGHQPSLAGEIFS